MTVAPQTVSFGCRLNLYEAEVMRAHAAQAGIDNAVIVNTCAVTAEAERQARQAIRKLRRERPDVRIIVTGCAAQVHAASFAAMPEVNHIIGNEAKLDAATFRALEHARGPLSPAQSGIALETPPVASFAHGPRGFVQVQNGCDHRCTFCIIPYGRGPSRSVPFGQIVAQARSLLQAGTPEIVLTGVDIASYGRDMPGQPGLGQMVRRLLALLPELQRLRLSSLDPAGLDEDLWYLIATEPRLLPHLHLSLQAGDDLVLKRMKRRHTRAQAVDLCRRARALRPDITFGADMIAGFPTEDDAMFDNTLRLVEECELTWLHVFPYSPRAGTPAAKMPQVDGSVRRKRAAALRIAGEAQVRRHLRAMQGRELEILIERPGLGRTPSYAELCCDGGVTGSVVTATVTGMMGHQLTGSLTR